MPPANALSRRRFLRGLGVTLALPSFASLVRPQTAAAATGSATLATTSSGAPLRTAFLYIPNGVNVKEWRPIGEGTEFEFGPTMQGLKEFKNDLQVFTGFEHKNGWAGGDGPGDHARANATILTGARPKKTAGSDIRVGVSIDQFAAQHIGHQTRFPSLELSCDGARSSGSCDSGYSCAYQFNLSWRTETTPVAPENNPRLVFERLFGAGNHAERVAAYRERMERQRSLLDFVMEDARQLNKQLGGNDRRKLDEYLTGVREIEFRIQQTEKFGELPDPGIASPSGIPGDYREHLRLMGDLMVSAFQTDSTRMATFLMAHDGSNRSFKDIGVTDGHHALSHHQSDQEKLDKIAKIDRFYIEQFAYILGKLRDTQDVDGKSLLHNTMLVYAGGLSDGNRHNHDDLPVIVAGHAGGRFTTGRHVMLDGKVPMTNLFLRMVSELGVNAESFGDSTGKLEIV